MSKPHEYPPAYDGPQQPQASYQYPGPYGQNPGNNGYYQSQQNMGYHQQGPYAQGGYQQPYQPQQGGYYPQPGAHPQRQYQEPSSSSGCLQGILAGLACCCCLDCLF
ncbi:hypothetical protein AB5N19_10803 [Seiridium cardinale]